MKRQISKFLLAFMIHATLSIILYMVITRSEISSLFFGINPNFVLATHIFSSLFYFIFIWTELYQHDYTFFLNYSSKLIFLCFVFTSGMVFASITFLYLIDSQFLQNNLFSLFRFESYLFVISLILIINFTAYLIFYIIKLQWIKHLVGLGYLKKNTIIFGNPDTRFPTGYVQYGNPTRAYKGMIFKMDGKWFFRNENDVITGLKRSRIQHLLFSLQISEVIIFLCHELSKQDTYMVVDCLRKNNISYSLVPDVNKLLRQKFWRSSFSYIPIIERFSTNRDSLTQITIKRVLDLLLVSISLLLFVPIGIAIGIAIKLEDGGPVFYIRNRVGKDGKNIRFLKFRSMHLDAESKQKSLMRYNIRTGGPLFKMKNDPRITRVGKIIRRFSLDELPQLINVLKGDMSLVGPRPHLVSEVAFYKSTDLLRLECISGITCFPQIYGRSTLGFRNWIDLDLSYRENWSIILDLKILLHSFLVVVSPFRNKTLY